MREKYIVSLNNCGISNRLKCLVSVLRLCNWLSRSPIIYWHKNRYVQCEFADLFTNNIQVINNENSFKKLLVESNWKQFRDANRSLLISMHDCILISTWRLLTLPNELPHGFARSLPSLRGTDIDFEFHRIPPHIQYDYSKIFSTLTPIEYISEQVENFARQFDSNTVSLSIRSWIESKIRYSLFDITMFYDVLDQLANANFFISCDSSDVLNKIIERYGSRVIHYPKRTSVGDRNSLHGMQDILIDLYLLAKNNILIASYASTFSEIAWWLGNCQANVKLIGIDESQTQKSIIIADAKARISLIWRNLFYKNLLKAHSMITD